MGFGIAKFRIAKFSHCEFGIARFSHCEIGIGSVNSKLALRNGIWHCEISHCEIFALRNWNWHCEMAFGIAKFRIAKFSHCEWHCEISHCEIFALRNWVGEFSHCEMGLRTVCENLFLLIFHACLPVFNCISLSSLFLRFSIEFWAC